MCKPFLKTALNDVPDLFKYKSIVKDRSADLTLRLEAIQSKKDTMNKLGDIELRCRGLGVGGAGVTDYARTEYGGIIYNLDDIHQVGILGLAHRVSDQLNRFIDRKPDRFLT